MSGFSILTNTGAQVALANLGAVNSQLGAVQKKVSTGQQVADATDNAAVFAVAQGIRANLQAYNAVNTGLNDAQALVQTALAATTSVSNVIGSITQTLTQLSDGSLSDQQRQIYTAQLKNQIDEVQSVILAANYNGENLLIPNINGQAFGFFGSWNPQQSIAILAAPNGQRLYIQPSNIYGGEANGGPYSQYNIDGFFGLARLAYYVGDSNTLNDVVSGNYLYFSGNYPLSRSEVGSNEAAAALVAISNTKNDFVYQSGASTNSGQSVFDASVALYARVINTALGSLGATTNNLQLQLTFNQSISNALAGGLGNLVDADLAQASAQLTALQTQQQLATQTLAIANAQPKVILSLFK